MTRKIVQFISSILVLVGSISALTWIQDAKDFELRGYVDATQNHHVPFRMPLLGVNAELTQYDTQNLNTQLSRMRSANIHWVRQIFRWDEIEPRRGEFDWTVWDAIITSIDNYPEIQLIAVIQHTPEWARPENISNSSTVTPQNLNDFTEFLQVFTTRYGNSIDYYQIWDAPNLRGGWGNQAPSADQYAEILNAAYETIHSHDVQAHVIAAALAPILDSDEDENVSEIDFLRQLYAAGASEFMDGAAGKPYGFTTSPLDRTIDAAAPNFSQFIRLREIMVQNGDAHKPLWASEWGWNSLPDDWTGEISPYGTVTAQNQIAFTQDALQRADREWAWIGGMILSHWQPNAPPTHSDWGFALNTMQGTPSPLLDTLQSRPTVPAATNGLYPVRNPVTQYSGTWSFNQNSADIGWVNDSTLNFRFHGTEVAILINEDDYVAQLYPSITDETVNALPQDPNGVPFLLLTSDTLTPQTSLITVASGLPNEIHTLNIRADELIPDEVNPRQAIAGFAVSSGNLAAPYNQQIALAQLTIFISLIATVTSLLRVPFSITALTSIASLIENIRKLPKPFISKLTSELLSRSSITQVAEWQLQIAAFGLSAIAIFLPLHPIIVALIALLLFVIVYAKVLIGLQLIIFWAPFFLSPVEIYGLRFPLVEIVLYVTAAAWLVRSYIQWGNGNIPSANNLTSQLERLNSIDVFIIIWTVLGVAALTWSQYTDPAITELRTLFIQPALFYLLLRTSYLSKQQLTSLIYALLMSTIAVSVIGIAQFLTGESVITAEEGARRLASVYGSPNNVGLLIGRSLPFMLALFLLNNTPQRRIYGVLLIIVGFTAMLTQSSGTLFVGLPVGIISVLILSLRRRAIIPLIGLTILASIAMIVALQFPRFSNLLDFTQGTNFYRLRVWDSAIQMVLHHPITGIGLDQFLYAFRGTYIMPDAWQEPTLSHPHNIMLDFWTRLGISGVLWIIGVQIVFWQRLLRHYRQQQTQHNQMTLALTIGTMGAMAGLLAHGLVDNSVFVIDLAYIFMLLLYIAASIPNTSAIDEGAKTVV